MYGLMNPQTGLTQRVGYPQGSAVVQGGGAPTGSGVIDNVTVPPPPLPGLRSINTVTPEKPRQPKTNADISNLGMLYPTIFDMAGNADTFGGPGQQAAMTALGKQAMTGEAPAHIKPWGTKDEMKRAAHMGLQQMAGSRPYSGLASAIMGGGGR